MCEITNGKIFVADRDIDCYKIVKEKMDMRIEAGQTKFVKIMVPAIYQAIGSYELGQVYHLNNFENRCINKDVVTIWLFRKYDSVWNKKTITVEEFRHLIRQISIYNISGYCDYDKNGFYNFYNSPYRTCQIIHNEDNLKQTLAGYYSYAHYMNGKMEKDMEWYKKMQDGYYTIVKCTIPEGSKYLVSDSSDCFVSENIVLNRIVN